MSVIEAAIAALIGVNLLTLALYGYDKWAAGRRRRRIAERTLHFFALIGGSPAALLSQIAFRHKTIKGSFQLVFWLIVLLQAGAVVGGFLWWTSRGD